MSAAGHVFKAYRDGRTNFECGHSVPGQVQAMDGGFASQHGDLEDATCLHCLRSLRDRALRCAARSAEQAKTASERYVSEQIRRARRKRLSARRRSA